MRSQSQQSASFLVSVKECMFKVIRVLLKNNRISISLHADAPYIDPYFGSILLSIAFLQVVGLLFFACVLAVPSPPLDRLLEGHRLGHVHRLDHL